jgi:hypothetical protein
MRILRSRHESQRQRLLHYYQARAVVGTEIYSKWNAERVGMISLRGAVRYQIRVMEGAPPTGAGIEFVNVSGEILNKLQMLIGAEG